MLKNPKQEENEWMGLALAKDEMGTSKALVSITFQSVSAI